MPVSPVLFSRRHPWLRTSLAFCLASIFLLAGLAGVLAYKNHHARTLAEETCGFAKQGARLSEFRSAIRVRGYAFSEVSPRPGEPVVMVSFPAINIESYVCVVSARGEQIVSAEVSFHD